MRGVLLPWLTADESIIRAANYYLHEDESATTPLPQSHPAWDPTVDVHLSAEVEVTPAGLLERCELRPGDKLQVVLSWHSEGTTLRGVNARGISPMFTPRAQPQTFTLHMSVPGPNIADVVIPVVRLVLVATADGQRSAIAASRPGSILWSNQWNDDVRLLTDGVAGIFPVRFADFAAVGLPTQAGWHLRWEPDDFRIPATAAMTLYINTAHEPIYRAVQGAATVPAAAAIREAIILDVLTQMVFNTLENPEFIDGVEYEDGAIGMVCAHLLAALFPGHTLNTLRSDRRHDPSQMRASMQSRLGTFREVRV